MKTLSRKKLQAAFYLDSLKKKYGRGIQTDLYQIRDNPSYTLAWLAGRHGFTREYARQIFNKYFQYPYTKIKNKQSNKKKLRRIMRSEKNQNPKEKIKHYKKGESGAYKGMLIELLALKTCQSLGFKYTTKNTTRIVDLNINGFFCEVKSAHSAYEINKGYDHRFFHCIISPKQMEKADFVFFYIAPADTFYVIPINNVPKGGCIYIPEADVPHRYCDFKESWGLLIKKVSDII